MFDSALEKFNFVNRVFSSVSGRYDLMNNLMSLGTHRLWKDSFVDLIELKTDFNCLDIAAGSGDISINLLKKADKLGVKLNLEISDINPDMLVLAKTRLVNKFSRHSINFRLLDATSTDSVKPSEFDLITCAFGVRNFANLEAGLLNIFQMLKTGGRFYCLEFSFDNVSNPLLKAVYSKYLDQIVPKLGKYVAKDESAYDYLAKSIKAFPNKLDFKKILEGAGFCYSGCTDIFGGIVTIHYAIK